MAAESFDPIYQHILKSEGGLSDRNLKADPGGRTMMGVTQKTYNAWRASQGLPQQDVASIGPAEHRTIFKNEYWDAIKGDKLPVGLDYAVMDTAINAGPGRATKLLQRTLGLDEDGVMGNDTVAALGGTTPAEILGQYTGTRRAFQLALPNAAANPGWGPRINSVNKFAADAIRNNGFGGDTLTVPVGAQAGNDDFGAGFKVSDGIGVVEPGFIGDSGRALETGDPYGFTQTNAAGNVGPGSNNLGTATPIGPAPGKYDFANGGTPGGIGDANFGAGIAPSPLPGPPPGPYDFGSGMAGGDTPNGSFGSGIGQPPLTPAPTIGAGPTAPSVPYNGFDAKAYLAANADVAAAGMDPLQHYLQYGFKEGRTLDPEGHQIAPGFDAASYLRANPDVAAARIDPLTHYLVNGAAEGRTIGAPSLSPTLGPTNSVTAFDPGAYLQANKDVAAAGLNPLEHYLRYGQYENRDLNLSGQKFDAAAYLASSPDVAKAGMSPLQHYLEFGSKEGRQAQLIGPDGQASLISNWLPAGTQMPSNLAEILNTAQAARPVGAGATVPTFGATSAPTIGPSAGQSITASPGIGAYDFASNYLTANRDVAEAGQNPWEHFLRYGFKEGRAINTAGDRFDPNAYLSENADVLKAGQDPLLHYVRYGANEGRAAPIIGPDGTVRDIGSLGLTPTISADLARLLQPQSVAPIIGPQMAPTIGAPDAVQAWSQGVVSPFGFSTQNVSQNVGPGSFGAGITPMPSISPFGFSTANVGGALGATNQGLGGSYAVGSAADLGFGGGSGGSPSGEISNFGFGGDVSGYDVNQGGGQPAQQDAPAPSGFGDGASVQGRNSQLSQNEYFATQARQQALATANNNLFGQQITSVAPGNQTVYDYATGKATGGPAPQVQPFVQAPVNMSSVFAPLPTAVFMPRFTF